MNLSELENRIEELDLKITQVGSRPDGYNGLSKQVHFKIEHKALSKPIYFSAGVGHYLQHLPRYEMGLFTDLLRQSDEKDVKRNGWMRLDHMKHRAAGSNHGITIPINKILRLENFEVEKRRGVYPESPKRTFVRPKLNTLDLFYCLTLDSAALFQSFDDWCMELGYDNDSIKDNECYNNCCDNARALIALGFDINELQELFQDY